MTKKRGNINKIGLIILISVFFYFFQGKNSLFAINLGNIWVLQENLEPDTNSNCDIHSDSGYIYQKASILRQGSAHVLTGLGNTKPSHIKLVQLLGLLPSLHLGIRARHINSCRPKGPKSIANSISSEEIRLIAGKNKAKTEKYPIASIKRKYRELNFELSVARTNLWFFPLGAAGSMGVGYLMIQLEPANWWRSIIWVYGWAGIASSAVAVGMTFYSIYRFFSVKGKLKRFRSDYRESLSKEYPGFPESAKRFIPWNESLYGRTKFLGNNQYIKIFLVKINFG